MLTGERRKTNGGRLIGEVEEVWHFIFVLFHICSGGPTRSFHFCHMERNRCRVQNMFGCFLVLSCLLSFPASSSCHESPSKHTYILTHIHTQRTSGYAYCMSPPPLKASLPFSFCNLEQSWWDGSQILHLRAVSFLYRNQKLLFMGNLWVHVWCSLKHHYVIQ